MLTFKNAGIEDAKFLFDLRNEPANRESAFNSGPLVWEDHLTWLKQKLESPSAFIYILFVDATSVGQIRFDIDDSKKAAFVDIGVNQNHRGKGLAAEGLTQTAAKMFSETTVTRIIAQVKCGNLPSIKCFEKAGFVIKGTEIIKNCECCVLELSS